MSLTQLRKVAELNKSIKKKSIDYKIDKEYGHESLKEFYKPITDIKTKEQDVIKTQNIELKEELAKQTLVIPLIKSISKYPRIINYLEGNTEGEDLTDQEQNIIKQLKDIDDQTLLTLIDYYDKPENKNLSLLSELPGSPKELIDTNYAKYLIYQQFKTPEDTRKILTEGNDVLSGKEAKEEITKYLEYVVKKNKAPNLGSKPWSTIKAADEDFYNELYKIKHGKYPTTRKPKPKTSTPAKPKTSAPKVFTTPDEPSPIKGEGLLKKLNILYAEKLAGNNNVANEAIEILDKLKKNKIIDTEKLKETSKLFK